MQIARQALGVRTGIPEGCTAARCLVAALMGILQPKRIRLPLRAKAVITEKR